MPAAALFLAGSVGYGGALEDYVQKADETFSWRVQEERQSDGAQVTRLELISQSWREHEWRHSLVIVRPDRVRNPDMALLWITGDGTGEDYIDPLKKLAGQAGATAAVVTRIPNQPLYDGRKEDALIAFTFKNYLESGDATWPLLFPMTKGAVRAMDAVQAYVSEKSNESIERFLVTGASKRGWTTYLTAAVDSRVKAMAPIVIDMLNMKAHTQWAQKMYGRQSEQIHDYTDLNLIEQMDDPTMTQLRQWVDPYHYRDRYTMPKLLLLGTNDPYWVVDSTRHYFDELPEPKLIYQTPNAGHGLNGGDEALRTLAAFYEMIADNHPVPRMDWEFQENPRLSALLSIEIGRPAKQLRLWTAESEDRDFRDEQWSSRELSIQPDNRQLSVAVETPDSGYRAYFAEVLFESPKGMDYKLSTEVRVTPDQLRDSVQESR